MSEGKIYVPPGAESEQAAGGPLEQVTRRMEEYVGGYPVSSVLATFGMGLALGLAIGATLAESDLIYRRRKTMAERIGQRVLDSLGGMLPEAIASRIPR